LLLCQAQLIREQQRLREQEEERLRKEEEERIRKEEEAERLKEEKVSIVYCIALFSFLSVCLRVCL